MKKRETKARVSATDFITRSTFEALINFIQALKTNFPIYVAIYYVKNLELANSLNLIITLDIFFIAILFVVEVYLNFLLRYKNNGKFKKNQNSLLLVYIRSIITILTTVLINIVASSVSDNSNISWLALIQLILDFLFVSIQNLAKESRF